MHDAALSAAACAILPHPWAIQGMPSLLHGASRSGKCGFCWWRINVELSGLVTANLRRSGFAVDQAKLLEEAQAALATTRYDIILLDLRLPDGDGFDLIRGLRRVKDSTPIIVLTARDRLNDRVEGLNLGADDYLVKPFAHEELLARVQAVLRRPKEAREPEVSLANLTVGMEIAEVSVADRALEVPRRELAVLRLLMRRAGRVVSRESLENAMYDDSREIEFERAGGRDLAAAQAPRRRRRGGRGAGCAQRRLSHKGEDRLSGHASIGRQLIWRLSALFLLSLLLSAAIFLYEAWVNRIDTLDKSLRGAAAQLAATVERGPGAGQLRISDAAATGLAPVELPSLRYAVIDRGSGAVADGSSTSLLQELGADAAGRPEGGFDFRDAERPDRSRLCDARAREGTFRSPSSSPAPPSASPTRSPGCRTRP